MSNDSKMNADDGRVATAWYPDTAHASSPKRVRAHTANFKII
jgi:hypothetical protein